MSALQRRFEGVINLLGDTFTISSISHKGVFTPLSPNAARTYLFDADALGGTRPLYSTYVSSSDTSQVGQVATYQGDNYTIGAVVDLRHRDETVAKLLVMHRPAY